MNSAQIVDDPHPTAAQRAAMVLASDARIIWHPIGRVSGIIQGGPDGWRALLCVHPDGSVTIGSHYGRHMTMAEALASDMAAEALRV